MSDPIPPASSTYDLRPLEVFVVQERPRRRYWLHGLLLLATIFTTLVVGARLEFNFLHDLPAFSLDDSTLPLFPLRWVVTEPSRLLLGVPFAGTLLLILLSHEMGHYLYCMRYGVNATLPFFIPAPTLIGTLGAFIRIKSPIRSREALFDIGIAGPIAGFVVAFITLVAALGLSKPLPPGMPSSDIVVGYPLVFHLAQRLLGMLGMGPG
ncbi:MAG: site-2 protease family protein, partial [Terriglobales bacterium]